MVPYFSKLRGMISLISWFNMYLLRILFRLKVLDSTLMGIKNLRETELSLNCDSKSRLDMLVGLLFLIGSLNPKMVKFFSLCLMWMSPPIYFVSSQLHASPIPIVPFWTLDAFCLILSSLKGLNSVFYWSGEMPKPVSIISVSST